MKATTERLTYNMHQVFVEDSEKNLRVLSMTLVESRDRDGIPCYEVQGDDESLYYSLSDAKKDALAMYWNDEYKVIVSKNIPKVRLLEKPDFYATGLIVLCKWGNQFVTWFYRPSTDEYDLGHYFSSTPQGLRDALNDFERRI